MSVGGIGGQEPPYQPEQSGGSSIPQLLSQIKNNFLAVQQMYEKTHQLDQAALDALTSEVPRLMFSYPSGSSAHHWATDIERNLESFLRVSDYSQRCEWLNRALFHIQKLEDS